MDRLPSNRKRDIYNGRNMRHNQPTALEMGPHYPNLIPERVRRCYHLHLREDMANTLKDKIRTGLTTAP